MIVTKDNFVSVMRTLKESRRLAVDTETTGLRPYGGDSVFSVIIAPSAKRAFYFNFNMAADIPPEAVLTQTHAEGLKRLFTNPKIELFLHNAKFDMAMLETVGIQLYGKIHDTMIVERLLDNNAASLSLDACAKKIGLSKDDKVAEYIKKKKLFTESTFGHKNIKNLHYDQVPFELIVPYAEADTMITFALGEHQLTKVTELTTAQRSFGLLYKNELQLLRTVYAMEKRGVMIDRKYCERAIDYESALIDSNIEQFKAMTGKDFIDSADLYMEIFKNEEITFGEETATGQRNPRFDNYVLEGFKSPLAKHILGYRSAKKRRDFYENFAFFGGKDDVLHAGFNQAGTKTGRFSAWEPNLQQLKKDEGDDLKQEYVVRRALVPRPGFMFLMLDYNQVEYRLILDDCKSEGLIKEINKGMDVHQATADLAGISRKDAKTINFAILYGAGAKKIAKSLGITEDEAKRLKYRVLDASPAIGRYIKTVMRKVKLGGEISNWFGRIYKFPDAEFAYRAPNTLVQGGAADVMKIAMNRVHAFLEERQSKLVMTIHDELVIELSDKEKFLVPKLKSIMEDVYKPIGGLHMTCSAEYSLTNLADKQKLPGNDKVEGV